MASSFQTSWVNESFNGRGWENSLEISSLEELRSRLLELGASVSFNDDSIGITHLHTNVNSRFITSNTSIDSYRSYLATDQHETNFTHLHGNFIDEETSYNISPSTIPLRQTTNSLNILRNENNPGEKGYIVFNFNSAGMELENGFMITPQSVPGGAANQVNPEIVFALKDEFWDDYQNFRNDIDNQKAIGNNISFEVNGLGSTVDLSALRSATDDSVIDDLLDKFKFTVVTDQEWNLPLYSSADVRAKVKLTDENNSALSTNLEVWLRDHDLDGHQPPAMHGYSGAIERTANGDGTVFEFGLDEGQLKNLIEDVQENWNTASANTIFEVQGINFNFNNLPTVGGGTGTHPYHLYSEEVESGNQYLTLKPVTTDISNFSEFGDIGIEASGDFNSVIDFWSNDENSPFIELTSPDGMSRFENANLTLNYQAINEFGELIPGKNINVISNLHLTSDHNNINFHTNNGEFPDGIVDFELTSINFNANPWNIQTNNPIPVPAGAAMTPEQVAALAGMAPDAAAAAMGMTPAGLAALVAMNPADAARIAAMPPAQFTALAGQTQAAAATALGVSLVQLEATAGIAAIASMTPADAAIAAAALGMDPNIAHTFAVMDPASAAGLAAINSAPVPPAANNTPVFWNYNVNEAGELIRTNGSYDKDGNPIEIYDYIDNADDLVQLKISGLNDFSKLEELDASVELTLNNERLEWNKNYTVPVITNTLETYYSLQELDQLAVLGDSVKEDSIYDLTITAKMLGDLRLEGAGLKIEFDNTLFKDLEASDIHLGHSFAAGYVDKETGHGPIRVDNENGEIYISAMSAEDLGWGHAISDESVFAKISLDFDEAELRKIAQNNDGSLKIEGDQLEFGIKANLDDTIFTEIMRMVQA